MGRFELKGMRSARRTLIAAMMLSISLLTTSAWAETFELPATGVWNTFQSQVNILECANASDVSYDFLVTVRSNSGAALHSQSVNLQPFGSVHIPLNAFLPADSYGTFLLEHASQTSQGDSPLNCATTVYRFPSGASTKVVDYAFALPLRNALKGTSAGIFNSINPQAGGGPTENWLTIYNGGNSVFSADVQVYREDGSQDLGASFFLSDLQPGERRDFGLGHPSGQVLGIYRIVPSNPSAPYGAFVTRYSFKAGGGFNFAFPVFAEKGGCDLGAIPASTMDPAINWGEIANIGDSPLPVSVEIRGPDGGLKFQEGYTIAPRSQKHVYVNAPLGDRQVGTLEVRCNSGLALVQSAFYGYRTSFTPIVEWAYISQARGQQATEGERLSFLANTFLGAANWNKLLDSSEVQSVLNTAFYDGAGKNIRRYAKVLFASGGLDLAVHEETGINFTGQVLSYSNTPSALIGGELLRVYPDSRGGIGAIMNIPPRILTASDKQKGAVEVSASGHFLDFRNRKVHIVGDSITQGWMELGTDFNTAAYLDHLQSQGINAIMIWSFIGIVNQSQDSRVGYHAPRRWPWPEITGNLTPPYRFEYVDAFLRPKFNENYFAALRDLVRGANERNILVLLTVHDGWTKDRFSGHPLNVANGGTLAVNREYVTLADYTREMPATFSPSFTNLQAHQFVLERFSDRLIRATADFPNIMYEMFNEGEWYDQTKLRAFQIHFLDFFKSRTDQPLLVNDDHVTGANFLQEANTDVITLHTPNWNGGTDADDAFDEYEERFFAGNPLKRPIIFDEPVPEYRGNASQQTALMRLMWGTLLGGAGYFMPNDSSWKTSAAPTDYIFSIESFAARFFAENNIPFWEMEPNGSCLQGNHVCFAKPNEHYVLYSKGPGGSGSRNVTLNLSGLSGSFQVRVYSPRAGVFDDSNGTVSGGNANTVVHIFNTDDWVIWLKKL